MANAMLDARQEDGGYRRVELITGQRRRRRWTAEEKARIVAESFEEGANISEVAREDPQADRTYSRTVLAWPNPLCVRQRRNCKSRSKALPFAAWMALSPANAKRSDFLTHGSAPTTRSSLLKGIGSVMRGIPFVLWRGISKRAH